MTKHRTEVVFAFDRSVYGRQERALLKAVRGSGIEILKVGLEAMTARAGWRRKSVADRAAAAWGPERILWDQKIHDIPETVQRAVYNLTGTVWGVTLHASGGTAMLQAAVTGWRKKLHDIGAEGIRTTLFGVTVLTSLSGECESIFGSEPAAKVLQFVRFCANEGIGGVVCSGQELQSLSNSGFSGVVKTLVPGIRPAWATVNDQARTMTPRDAARLGADYIVVGRPISDGPYAPSEAVRRIREELGAYG